jgi:hypothetical protein
VASIDQRPNFVMEWNLFRTISWATVWVAFLQTQPVILFLSNEALI